MALDIPAIAAKLNELVTTSPSYPIGKPQELRMQLQKPIYRRLFGGTCFFLYSLNKTLAYLVRYALLSG